MNNQLLLGCIADDFTGATDLANNLVRAGMRVVQANGVPADAISTDVDAVVVALKSRTIAPHEAVAQSLAALGWLQRQGARQIYFKYCSTFDSRFEGDARGNIGPVIDALMNALGCDFTIATPAFPDNGRTVFKGHLFVGDALLQDSSMRAHPLTPMTDSNLLRVLQAQTRHRVGLIDHAVVSQGAAAIGAHMSRLRADGIGIAVIDALSNADLMRLGPALADLPLITAGSGVAIALPANAGLQPSAAAASLPPAQGFRAAVCGSCSTASNRQVAHFMEAGYPALALDPIRIAAGIDVVGEALDWATPLLGQGPVLIYSTTVAGAVKSVQEVLGASAAGELVERTLATIAKALIQQKGVRQLLVGGGETSGACVQALEIDQMQIGQQIDPGIPWCYAHRAGLHIALKSGNFGQDDFFIRAFEELP